jgi:hypothetical protein
VAQLLQLLVDRLALMKQERDGLFPKVLGLVYDLAHNGVALWWAGVS